MNKRVAFIGHRQVFYKNNIKKRLYDEIKNKINCGYKNFIMGTHGDFDKITLSICKELKKIYNDIIIEIAITSFNTVKKKNNEDYENNYYNEFQIVMFDIEEVYFKKKITISNRLMIDTSDTLICYVDKNKSRSGAKTAMNYAKRKGLEIINIYHEEDSPTFNMTKEQEKKYWNL